MNKKRIPIYVAIIFAILLAGCGGNTPTPVPTSSNDLLAKTLARGTLVVSTDAAYPPQSELIPNAKRAANTKCASNEHTAAEFRGFDIAVASEIAKRLGVEPCFVTPQWSQIIVGNWDGRWDISVGSVAVTPERLAVLYFAQPYYSTPVAFFIHKDNKTFSNPADLSGKKIGACVGCTYDMYLRGGLEIPGEPIDFVVKDPQIVGYDVDSTALSDLATGDGTNLDAVLTALPTGLDAIQNGAPLKQLGDPVFYEILAVAMDKKSNFNSFSLALKVTEIVQGMHKDGSLAKLSDQYFHMDLTPLAGKIDVKSFGQFP